MYLNMQSTEQVLRTKGEFQHMPQLDALRTFAVAAVMIHHFVGNHLPWVMEQIPWGFLGVRLFFTLSGFLITGILLRTRSRAERSGKGLMYVTRQFYMRRFLRIFPLYYLVIGITAAINLPPVREVFFWLITYTFNIQISIQGWFPENISHFWSLAVEEQFYIFWPWLVLFTPRRWLLRATLAMISLGPLFRAYAVFTDTNEVATYCLTFSALDTLGLGALLAMAWNEEFSNASLRTFFKRYALPIGLIGSVLVNVLLSTGVEWRAYMIIFDTTAALCFCWLVSAAGTGFRGWTGRLLESKPLLYCGKITYGIYVYHLFMPLLLTEIFTMLGARYPGPGWLNFTLASMATLIVATVSWYLFEQPINNLKRFFAYSPAADKGTPGIHSGTVHAGGVEVASVSDVATARGD
jgi:peptidoglycan/LPS O-acetylase OafA/YrhL